MSASFFEAGMNCAWMFLLGYGVGILVGVLIEWVRQRESRADVFHGLSSAYTQYLVIESTEGDAKVVGRFIHQSEAMRAATKYKAKLSLKQLALGTDVRVVKALAMR